MNKTKMTPWFTGDQKPVRAGVYEREYGFSSPCYSYWNGEFWLEGAFSVKHARSRVFEGYSSPYQALLWRGVLK